MRLLIQFIDGSVEAAIFAAALGSRMRVFIPGAEDAVELRWDGGRWFAENGEPVQVRFEPPAEEFLLCAESATNEQAGPLNPSPILIGKTAGAHAGLN